MGWGFYEIIAMREASVQRCRGCPTEPPGMNSVLSSCELLLISHLPAGRRQGKKGMTTGTPAALIMTGVMKLYFFGTCKSAHRNRVTFTNSLPCATKGGRKRPEPLMERERERGPGSRIG